MAFYPNHFLSSAYLIGAVNGRPSKEAIRQNYIGLGLLPWDEVPERQVVWDVMESENNLAGVFAPKDQAVPGDDLLFSSVYANMIDVKASRMLESWAVQQLRDPGMPSVYKAGGAATAIKGMQQRLRDHFNKRLAWSNQVVDSQIEYFALHALQGNIVWPPVDNNGAAITYPMPHWNAKMPVNVTFPLPAGQNQAATTLAGYVTGGSARSGGGAAWTDATNADPLKDLRVINEYVSKTLGIRLQGGRILMPTTVLNYMLECDNVLKWIAGTDYTQTGTRQYASEANLKAFIQTQVGWTIETYDAQWTFRTRSPGTKPTITRVDFLKDGYIIILPPGETMGHMMTAPLQSSPGASGTWVYGKMGWKYENPKPPFEIEVGVNVVAWPRFDFYDWFLMDCYN